MNKISFSHFLKSDGTKTNRAKIDAYQLGSEDFDGIELELNIVDGKINIDVFNKQDFSPSEIKEILKYLKSVDWDNGYEFIDYFDINDSSEMNLIANKPSNISDILSSQQNKNNLNNMLNILKNVI